MKISQDLDAHLFLLRFYLCIFIFAIGTRMYSNSKYLCYLVKEGDTFYIPTLILKTVSREIKGK